MALNQLRIAGLLQAALVAVLMGYQLRGAPPDPADNWPYVLGGYGFVAAVAPWLAAMPERSDFAVKFSAILGVLFAAPVALGAWWMTGTKYPIIAAGYWLLAGLWALHLAVAVALRMKEPKR